MRPETEIAIGLIILPFILFGDIFYVESRPKVCTKIVEVGGCNKNGFCGMRLKDGRFGKMHYPVVGGEFCE